MLGVFAFSLTIAKHRFTESSVRGGDRWHFIVASLGLGQFSNVEQLGLCRDPTQYVRANHSVGDQVDTPEFEVALAYSNNGDLRKQR